MSEMPDYKKYNREQLLDVKRNINKEKFPDRYAIVEEELRKRINEPPRETTGSMKKNRYQTFGRRFWAGFLDGLVLWPVFIALELLVLYIDLEGVYKFWFILNSLIPYIYSILMHYKYGQTVGKMATGVKVIDVSEEKSISFEQAFIRDSVPVLYSLLMVLIFLFYWGGIPSQMESYPIGSEMSLFTILMAIWGMFGFIWFFAEVITMLTNDKRRAVHDLMAKSVVVRTK